MELWFCLSKESKVNLTRIYKNLTRLDYVPPKDEDKRGIHLEVQIENLIEIDRLMKERTKGAWHE